MSNPTNLFPVELESLETLKYIGYNSQVAQSIWQAWVDQAEEDRGFFGRHATRHIRTHCAHVADAEGSNTTEWTATLRAYGLTQEFHDSIMDPLHEQVRLTQSAKYWAVDTIEIRLGALQEAQRRREGMTSERESFSRFPTVTTSSADQPNIPGQISLYKAIAYSRITRFRNGEIVLTSLLSANPTDFTSGTQPKGIYFGTQLWVAELYAKYAKRRENAGRIVILKMTLPNQYVESLPKHIFTFGDDWKHVVLNFRKAVHVKDLPYGLASIASKDLIIGPILKTHALLTDIDQITENNLMKDESTGEVGSQYAFLVNGIEDTLQETAVVEIISEMV